MMPATDIKPESTRSLPTNQPLTPDELRRMNAYWRACNYLSAGMIYLRSLKSPLLMLVEEVDVQHVAIAGTAGRVEVLIPFNAPPDRPTRIVIDSGADLVGGGARVEEFPVCDQYGLQGDAFSRAVLGEAPLEFPIEDAIANMRVIDACFRSAKSGGWEKV